jgi:hypothetical protein
MLDRLEAPTSNHAVLSGLTKPYAGWPGPVAKSPAGTADAASRVDRRPGQPDDVLAAQQHPLASQFVTAIRFSAGFVRR